MTILNRIKELTSKKGISLAELERQTNLSSGSITKWNKSSPSIDKVNALADYFDVSVDYLLGRTELPRYIVDDAERESSIEHAIESTFICGGEELTENDRNILKGIIEGYLKSK